MKKIFLFLIVFAAASCSKYSGDWIDTYDGGKGKKVVVLLPVKDHTQHTLPWDVSEEVAAEVRYSLMREKYVYSPSEEEMAPTLNFIGDLNYSSSNYAPLQAFEDADYVIFLELIEHEEVPYLEDRVEPFYADKTQVDAILMMKMRMKIVDLRRGEPTVVLEEIVHRNHMIAKQARPVDYELQGWKTRDYRETPIGVAHHELIVDIVQRLEKMVNGKG